MDSSPAAAENYPQKKPAYLIPTGLDLEWCFRESCRLVAIHCTLEEVTGIDALAGCTTIFEKVLPEWLLTSIAASDEGLSAAVSDAMQLHGLLQAALGMVMPVDEVKAFCPFIRKALNQTSNP